MLPPQPAGLNVVDKSSHLFDQASLLWGTLFFTNMMDPDNDSTPAHLAYHEVFDGDPFPAAMSQTGMPGPFDLMKGTSRAIFMNVLAMHFDRKHHTFVDEAELNGGVVVQGSKVSTKNIAYILVALKQFNEEFNGTPLQNAAQKTIKKQADFLLRTLHDGRGGFYSATTIGKGSHKEDKTVEAQAAAIRGLYAAYQATGRPRYLKAANTAYEYLIDRYYEESEQVFRSDLKSDYAIYTPQNFAIISGALREAALVGGYSEAPEIYTDFFINVANKMQLSEGAQSGESGGDSDGDGIPYIPEQPDNLPPVFASEAKYHFAGSVDSEDTRKNRFADKAFGLRNFPNPFNPATTIAFTLPETQFVTLKVYDITGRVVADLVNNNLGAGQHQFSFDGSQLASGIYFYRLQAGPNTLVRKINLLK
jgi:hypothetical protein